MDILVLHNRSSQQRKLYLLGVTSSNLLSATQGT